VDPLDAIRREVEGRGPYQPPGKKQARNKQPLPMHGRPRQPTASARASELGQHWYDLATRAGFDLPYDANYFSLALQRKIENDDEMKPLLLAEHADQVSRWVRKMIDVWWAPGDDDGGGYLTGEVQARNAKEYFLGHDWEDLREYARSSLLAKHLKEHGRKVEPPVYEDQQEYLDRLDAIRAKAQIDPFLRSLEDAPDRPEVDPQGRDRLRSWREKRRKK
jgi:hypothetical protein